MRDGGGGTAEVGGGGTTESGRSESGGIENAASAGWADSGAAGRADGTGGGAEGVAIAAPFALTAIGLGSGAGVATAAFSPLAIPAGSNAIGFVTTDVAPGTRLRSVAPGTDSTAGGLSPTSVAARARP